MAGDLWNALADPAQQEALRWRNRCCTLLLAVQSSIEESLALTAPSLKGRRHACLSSAPCCKTEQKAAACCSSCLPACLPSCICNDQ